MESATFNVPSITCGHCVKTIERELGELEGVVSVTAAVDTKTVVVRWGEPADREQIETLLTEINYPPES